jgi:hypothetical protein
VPRLKSNAGAATVKDSVAVGLRPPPVAVIVTVTVPRVAVDVAEKETVTVHVGLHGLLVNVAVTPVGSVDVVNVTGVVVPADSVAVIEDEGLDAPCTTVKLFGEGVDRLKLKAGVATVNDRVVEWLAPPPVPVMVIVDVPRVAADVAENDTVTVHVGLHGLFVNVAVTPLGKADVEKVTDEVDPLTRVAVMDDDGLDAPCMTVRLLGDGVDNEKSKAGAATVNDSVCE